MGSSKKHKEKRERKKHKKGRSRSRERETHKRSHKSSHRKDKYKSPPRNSIDNIEIISIQNNQCFQQQSEEMVKPNNSISGDAEDDFDIDQLLDSKLSENIDSSTLSKRSSRKRRCESALEELKKRQNLNNNDDSFEKSINEQFEQNCSPHIVKPHNVQEKHDLEDRNEPIQTKIGQELQDNEWTQPPFEYTEPQLSLNISETNKLRAKLGLKPLDLGDQIPGLGDANSSMGASKQVKEVFIKTENITDKKKTESLREKLKVMKDKRIIEEKLRQTKTVGESDSEEESAAEWVKKHQKLLQEKEIAEKRAKLLEEMDAEFGISALVEEEFHKKQAYTSQNLKGLTVGHNIEAFKEGHNIVLTLKDKDVLNEDDDVLENVNLIDNERYAKNIENKKKKPDYVAYEEPEYDEFGILKKKNLLSKYDEEIDGEKKDSFKIGNLNSTSISKEQELELIRLKLKQQKEVTLEMPEMKIANEYYTPEDLVKFKKPKKKIRKVRKSYTLKADDLLTDNLEDKEKDLGSRNLRQRFIEGENEITKNLMSNSSKKTIPLIDDDDAIGNEDLSNIVIDEDKVEKELHIALNKARKLKQRKILTSLSEKVVDAINIAGGKDIDIKKETKGGNIEMNSLAEFCRTLGEIPTYGMSGNRDEDADDMMDLERELLEERKQDIEAQNRGAWNEVDIDDKPAEISMRENEPILEEEPDISKGIAGALKLAMKKGYLDKESKKSSNIHRTSQLQAQSYTIEEKFYEDDKFGKRDRYTGPIQEFKEKTNYKPDVKLEYIDDGGRLLTAKEAFRYLSHKFHGKGPGKNKVDKRMKKVEQDTRLKQMSSTDTPLNTVKLLQAKQKETQSPYIVLSGGNKTLTQTLISKTKVP